MTFGAETVPTAAGPRWRRGRPTRAPRWPTSSAPRAPRCSPRSIRRRRRPRSWPRTASRTPSCARCRRGRATASRTTRAAWLAVTARRRAIDVIRREAEPRRQGGGGDGTAAAARRRTTPGTSAPRRATTCCAWSSPAATRRCSLETQVALSLRTLGGLSTAEVAPGAAGARGDDGEAAHAGEAEDRAGAGSPTGCRTTPSCPQRLAGVAATVYLIFNEGYASADEAVVRGTCADEAIRLGRLLAGLMPDEPTVLGLLALMLLQDARRATRLDAPATRCCSPTRTARAGTGRWSPRACRRWTPPCAHSPERPDPYVAQAAIAACHAVAPSWAATDWASIVSWYDTLLDRPGHARRPAQPGGRGRRARRPGGRAGAARRRRGPRRLPLVARRPRAELLRRLGRGDEARAAAERAAATGLGPGHLAPAAAAPVAGPARG